jgi:hypothetical protein
MVACPSLTPGQGTTVLHSAFQSLVCLRLPLLRQLSDRTWEVPMEFYVPALARCRGDILTVLVLEKEICSALNSWVTSNSS